MNNLIKRTLFGALYVGLVVASILVNPIFFGVLFLFITVYAIYEYHHLVASSKMVSILSMVLGGILFANVWTLHFYQSLPLRGIGYMAAGYSLLLMIALMLPMKQGLETTPSAWAHILISQIMIAVPFAFMNGILDNSKYLLLALFITIWVNDTGAYIVGCSTAKLPKGNHKMSPRISPNKSWEGLFGGFVFALIAGFVFYKVGWMPCLWKALVMCFAIAVAGTFGDLAESALKRSIGVKDSGRFLPGHGGALDRFDSLLLAAPVLYMTLLLL